MADGEARLSRRNLRNREYSGLRTRYRRDAVLPHLQIASNNRFPLRHPAFLSQHTRGLLEAGPCRSCKRATHADPSHADRSQVINAHLLTGKQDVNRFRRNGSDSKRPLGNAAPFDWRRRLTNRTGIGRAF
jgi:hypothetical protein